MFAVYLFTAVVGWIFVAIFLFSAADFDVDFDTDVDIDTDTGGPMSGTGLELLGALFSFRSLVFFAAFFGLTGILLDWLEVGSVFTLVLAIGIGLFAALVNVKLMQYLKRTSASSQLKDRKIAGNPAHVVVPITAGKRGKVSVDIDGQRLYLTAAPFNDRHNNEFGVGDTVVIVEVSNGSALVAPMDDLN